MKRNKLFTLTLATCAALLSACSTELETSGNPERAGAGEAIVAVSLQFPGADKPAGYAANPAGYADNNVPEGVALPAEKEIRSIAFIAFTTGGTGVYLSTEPTFAETGFIEPLVPVDKDNPVGNYTASFKVRSDNFTGKTTLVAVANFDEHGLTFDPGTLTIENLKAKLTEALEADKSIEYPLLMTVAQELDIVEGATVAANFKMERIMARVDVVNSAFDKTTPANGFVLTSARLLSAASQGTMIGGQEIAAPTYVNLKVQDEVKEVEPAEGDDLPPVKQQLAPMYVYENTNSEKGDATKLSATATSVEIKGTYKGKAYSKVIPFVTPKKVVGSTLKGGVIVPLARNTRYVVEIIAANETDVTFDLQVTDWAEGKTLDVELDFAAPVIEGLDGFTPGTGATWDATTKTLDITNATAGSAIELVARGNQDSDIAIETVYDSNDTPLAQHIIPERGELVGYADAEVGSLSRTYKFTVPQASGECPSLTKIIVYNTSYADAQTVITVKYAPFFVGGLTSSDAAVTFDPATGFIDLKNVPAGNTGTISFFATASSDLAATVKNEGITPNFYAVTTTEDEADPAILAKYGPGKRVTLSYGAISEKPEYAEIKVTADGDEATVKKMFVKCLKSPYAQSTTVVPGTDEQNMIVEDDIVYLAVNNGTHGTIDYVLLDNAGNADITLAPTAEYTTDGVSGIAESAKPKWATEGLAIASNEVTDSETLSAYKIVKRLVKVSLPAIIKNPAEATSFKVGFANETAQRLIPVYLSGITGSIIYSRDRSLRPVLVKNVWWAPINIGQGMIAVLGQPSSEGGYLYQWGRKQAFSLITTHIIDGPVAPDSPEIAGDNFIAAPNSPYDWLTPQDERLWNTGTEAKPIKTTNDPCPVGWRVPTETETKKLIGSHKLELPPTPSIDSNGVLTVSGDVTDTKLYFPAVGCLKYDKTITNPGKAALHWSSRINGIKASSAYFGTNNMAAGIDARANAQSVRCVQE